ncbi:hypothetical protein [Liquorilactobacillus mali]|nr:hypothetical protein LM596_04245 [Liquorilactobacillus mali]
MDGKKYYFYKDGKLLRESQIIDGVKYYFNAYTGVLES